MSEIGNIRFEKLDISGLYQLVSWANDEGWNLGPYDAEAFWCADPEGFYGFFLNDVMVGGGSVVSYCGEFGFMGLFIVRAEYRGNGIGRQLWYLRRNHLLMRLKPGAAIGMDGVVAMQSFYKKGGFEIAYRDERHQRMGAEFPLHSHISYIEDGDFNALCSFDRECFGFDRAQFLKAWVSFPNRSCFKYVEGGAIKGFAVIRKVENGYKVGPLFAERFDVAEELYKACLNEAVGELVVIDIPMANKDAVRLVEKYSTTPIFECARMYYGTPPATDVVKVYGITSLELG